MEEKWASGVQGQEKKSIYHISREIILSSVFSLSPQQIGYLPTLKVNLLDLAPSDAHILLFWKHPDTDTLQKHYSNRRTSQVLLHLAKGTSELSLHECYVARCHALL